MRALLRRPSFSLIVLLTLAIGTGSNSAIFSFVNGILLEPLPFRDPDRLVRIQTVTSGEAGLLSVRELGDIEENLNIFESVAAYRPGAQYAVGSGDHPQEAPATLCSRELLSTLGIPLLHGSTWPEELDRDESYEIILNHNFWIDHFGGDPAVIGKKISLDNAPNYTIHGILPPGFEFPEQVDLLRSIAITRRWVEDRDLRLVYGVARLRQGVSIEQARAELQRFAARLTEMYPAANAGVGFDVTPLKDLYVGEIRPYLLLLFGAVAFVMMIACANVINLLLTRAISRERELAVRTALGAGRFRLVRLLLTESLALSLLGGLLGIALAWWWVQSLAQIVRADPPFWMTATIDARVVVFTFLVSVLTGVLAGLSHWPKPVLLPCLCLAPSQMAKLEGGVARYAPTCIGGCPRY